MDLEKRQLAYAAARQWAMAVSQASQLQVLTAKLGQTAPEYEAWPQPDPEVWDLYASAPVRELRQDLWDTAQRLHGVVGRVRANAELISKLAQLDNETGDSGPVYELMRSQEELTGDLEALLAQLRETEHTMTAKMREELIGAS